MYKKPSLQRKCKKLKDMRAEVHTSFIEGNGIFKKTTLFRHGNCQIKFRRKIQTLLTKNSKVARALGHFDALTVT